MLGSVDPCRVSALEKVQRVGGRANSGCSVHSVGGAMLVFTLAHLSRHDGFHLSLHAPHQSTPPLPQTRLASCLSSCSSAQEAGQTDSNTETSYLIRTANLKRYLPKKTNTRRSFVFKHEGKYSSGAQSL